MGADADDPTPAPWGAGVVVHPALARVFAALRATDAAWLLLRGEEELADPEGDVDLLVEPALVPRLDAVLGAVGFSRVLAPGRGTHRFCFAHERERPHWLKLDVVSDLAFGPHQQWVTGLAQGCLDRRTDDGVLPRPTPVDQAWLHLLHLLLDRPRLTSDRLPATRAAAARADGVGEPARLVEQVLGVGSAAALVQVARHGGLDDVEEQARRLRRALTARQPLASRGRELLARARRRLQPPVLAARPMRGLVAAVLGADEAVAPALEAVQEGFPVPVVPVEASAPLQPGDPGHVAVLSASAFARVRWALARGRLVLVTGAHLGSSPPSGSEQPGAEGRPGFRLQLDDVVLVSTDTADPAPAGVRRVDASAAAAQDALADRLWSRFTDPVR